MGEEQRPDNMIHEAPRLVLSPYRQSSHGSGIGWDIFLLSTLSIGNPFLGMASSRTNTLVTSAPSHYPGISPHEKPRPCVTVVYIGFDVNVADLRALRGQI